MCLPGLPFENLLGTSIVHGNCTLCSCTAESVPTQFTQGTSKVHLQLSPQGKLPESVLTSSRAVAVPHADAAGGSC